MPVRIIDPREVPQRRGRIRSAILASSEWKQALELLVNGIQNGRALEINPPAHGKKPVIAFVVEMRKHLKGRPFECFKRDNLVYIVARPERPASAKGHRA